MTVKMKPKASAPEVDQAEPLWTMKNGKATSEVQPDSYYVFAPQHLVTYANLGECEKVDVSLYLADSDVVIALAYINQEQSGSRHPPQVFAVNMTAVAEEAARRFEECAARAKGNS